MFFSEEIRYHCSLSEFMTNTSMKSVLDVIFSGAHVFLLVLTPVDVSFPVPMSSYRYLLR